LAGFVLHTSGSFPVLFQTNKDYHMRFLTFVSLLALGSFAAAADHNCVNKTCPIDGKPVDTAVKMMPYNPKTDNTGKASPGRPMVGFCTMKCAETYEKDPSKYQEAIEKQKEATK